VLVNRFDTIYEHRLRQITTLHSVALTAIHLTAVNLLDVVAIHVEKIQPYFVFTVCGPLKAHPVDIGVRISPAYRTVRIFFNIISAIQSVVRYALASPETGGASW